MRPCSPRLTEVTCMDWRVLVIEKHPTVCRESFWGHPLETIATDGPSKFGPILKSIRKKMSILRPFFCRAWIELFFQAWLAKNFPCGFLIYSNFKTNIQRFVAGVECKDARYKTYWPGCVSHTFSWAQKLKLAPPAMWQLFGPKTISSLQTLLTGINWLGMLAWKFSSAARERIFEPKMLKIDNFVTFSPEIAPVCATNGAQAAQMIMIVSHLESYDGFCGSLSADFMIQYLHKLKASLFRIFEEGRNSDHTM